MSPNQKSDGKADHDSHVETLQDGELPKNIDKALAEGNAVQMRSELDDLPILKAVRIYWRIATICMMAAFSAALEGYRTPFTIPQLLPRSIVSVLIQDSRTCLDQLDRLQQGFHPPNVWWRHRAEPYPCCSLGWHAVDGPVRWCGPTAAHHGPNRAQECYAHYLAVTCCGMLKPLFSPY